jgi:signal recognition particle receptor subunit beta
MHSFLSGVYVPPGKGALTLVDIPGHERLRAKYMDQFKSASRGIIYVVDSSNIQKQLRDTAEYLFNILSDPVIHTAKTPLLVACNKQVIIKSYLVLIRLRFIFKTCVNRTSD